MAADHTVLLGYSQGHVGYMLRPEDWMMGGYEPSVTFWGPLAAEHIEADLHVAARNRELESRIQGVIEGDGSDASEGSSR